MKCLIDEKRVDLFPGWTIARGRSSHQRYSVKKGVLKNFVIFTKNLVMEPLFYKIAGLQVYNFI